MENALTTQLLEWIAKEPRTYAQAMEAWRTSCPRLSIWEDALADGLVEVQSGSSLTTAHVTLTPAGRDTITR